MVISKGFSLITNTFLDENRLQGLNEIGMEKKRDKRRNSLQGPCKDLRKYKECLTEPDDEEFAEEKKERIGYRFIKDESLWLQFKVPYLGEVKCNPVVTFASLVLIWLFIILCISERDRVPFNDLKAAITENFTWLYIACFSLFGIFVGAIFFSKYSSLKLGAADDEPEYNGISWFVMLFACGISNGIFQYSVYGPIHNYTKRNRFYSNPMLPDNELAQMSILQTMFHFGLHPWIVYSLVGLLLCIMSHREKLPLTMKSCVYPLIGDAIFSWIGDIIDIITIMCSLFGVCVNLVIAARQMNTGLSILYSKIDPDNILIQVVGIWCITTIATISTVSGVGKGIRRLSEAAFFMSLFILVVLLSLDNTSYLLNLYVQSIGVYLAKFIQLSWHTDAFEQLGPSHGYEDRNRFVPENFESPDGPKNWMDNWTIFMWGWWVAFTPFTAMFLAKISKGRTIKQYLLCTIILPTLYCFLSPVIYGGIGIRMERESNKIGLCCREETGWFTNSSSLLEMLGEQNLLGGEKVETYEPTMSWMCNDGGCNSCAKSTLENHSKSNTTYGDFIREYEYLGNDFGSVTLDRSVARLSCHENLPEKMWFNMIGAVPGIGKVLSPFSLMVMIIYFITSADSGALVINGLSANGDFDTSALQRAFWAIMEGMTATALIAAGGTKGITAVQTMAIMMALPFTLFIGIMCVATWRALKVTNGDSEPYGSDFRFGLFEPLGGIPYKKFEVKETRKLAGSFLLTIFIAPIKLAQIAGKVYLTGAEVSRWWAYGTLYIPLFSLSIIFGVLQITYSWSWAIAFFLYLTFCGCTAVLRMEVRDKFGISGNILEDFLASVFLYPGVIIQMEWTLDGMQEKDEESKDNNTTPLV